MKNLNLYLKMKLSLTYILILISALVLFGQTRTIDGQTISQTVSWSGEIRVTGDVVVAPSDY